MRSRIKSMIALGEKPDLVLVDYLGIVSPDQKGENRQNEVSAITRALKALAREMNVPFMVLAQLSRANAARGDKRPMLTDLRETGSVEQEADAVIFVHRDGYYDQTQDQSEGVLILAKQHNGPTGDVIVRWDMQFAAYQNAHGTLVAKYQ
jgi:replicative DNA helicase